MSTGTTACRKQVPPRGLTDLLPCRGEALLGVRPALLGVRPAMLGLHQALFCDRELRGALERELLRRLQLRLQPEPGCVKQRSWCI